MSDTQETSTPAPADLEAKAIEARRVWRKRKREGRLMTTASGLVLRVRDLTLIDLVKAGHIPQPLVGAVEVIFNTGRLTMAEAIKSLPALEAVVKAAVVHPKIVDGVSDKDDEVGLDEMTTDEKLSVVNYVNSSPIGLFNFLGDAAKS